MSQVKITTLMNLDGSKQASSSDVIDGATKTKAFSPFALTVLAGIDAAAQRATLVAAKSGSNSDITELTGLTKQLTALQGGVSKGYIDGLKLVYTGRRSLTITSGAAYIPGLDRVIDVPAPIVLTGLTLSPSLFFHAYLYDNAGTPAVEVVTAAPTVNYYGTSWHKIGDSTRRYLGSVLASVGSDIYGFRHDPLNGKMTYIEGQPGNAPFVLLSGYSGAFPGVTINTASVAPATTSTSLLMVVAGNNGNFGPLDQTTPPNAGPNWGTALGASAGTIQGPLEVNISKTPASLAGIYAYTSSGSISAYATGYYFER